MVHEKALLQHASLAINLVEIKQVQLLLPDGFAIVGGPWKSSRQSRECDENRRKFSSALRPADPRLEGAGNELAEVVAWPGPVGKDE